MMELFMVLAGIVAYFIVGYIVITLGLVIVHFVEDTYYTIRSYMDDINVIAYICWPLSFIVGTALIIVLSLRNFIRAAYAALGAVAVRFDTRSEHMDALLSKLDYNEGTMAWYKKDGVKVVSVSEIYLAGNVNVHHTLLTRAVAVNHALKHIRAKWREKKNEAKNAKLKTDISIEDLINTLD